MLVEMNWCRVRQIRECIAVVRRLTGSNYLSCFHLKSTECEPLQLKIPERRLGQISGVHSFHTSVISNVKNNTSTVQNEVITEKTKHPKISDNCGKTDTLLADQYLESLQGSHKYEYDDEPPVDNSSSEVDFDGLDDLSAGDFGIYLREKQEEIDLKLSRKGEVVESEGGSPEALPKDESPEGSRYDENYLEEIQLDPLVAPAVPTNTNNEEADRLILKSMVYDVYGETDPSEPISTTPCAGCGAFLHCTNPGIPGFISSRQYKSIPAKKLREQVCQRCYLLEKHNVALDISVTAEDYPKIISQVRRKWALAVVVVDLLDLPNSIFPNLPQLIGFNRPLYIVGNKVDLLPKDAKGYLKRTKDSLIQLCSQKGLDTNSKIKHVCLVSAKTGYGIEDLITRLMNHWAREGDIYILGCTNVGKSTLFNALLTSDYSKSSARDFIHRATVSTWPGTTLNLLKFPIINPRPWQLYQRVLRLKAQTSVEAQERHLRRHQLKKSHMSNAHLYATLMGQVGITFPGTNTGEDEGYKGFTQAAFSYNPKQGMKEGSVGREVLLRNDRIKEYEESHYRESSWCFDTPGVINPEQIINRLTQQELALVLPVKLLQPRTFFVRPTQVAYISGIGRIDYVKGAKPVYLTVFASRAIPVYVLDQDKADSFYAEKIGTDALAVPQGNQDRLNKLPSLVGKLFEFTGIGWKESTADITLSSLGWVSITAGKGMEVVLRAYTPGGVGCISRQPATLPYAVNLRGQRIRSRQSYQIRKPLM